MGKAMIPWIIGGAALGAGATALNKGHRQTGDFLQNMLLGGSLGGLGGGLLGGAGASSALPGVTGAASAVPMAGATGTLGEAGMSGAMGLVPNYAAGISPTMAPMLSAMNQGGKQGLTGQQAMMASKLMGGMGGGQGQQQSQSMPSPMMRGQAQPTPLQNPQIAGLDPQTLMRQQIARQKMLMGTDPMMTLMGGGLYG